MADRDATAVVERHRIAILTIGRVCADVVVELIGERDSSCWIQPE